MKAGRGCRLTLGVVAALALTASSVALGGPADGRAGWAFVRAGPGMMGYAPAGAGTPVRDIAGARQQAGRFAAALKLRVGEVMRFTRNYYAELLEPNGAKATEVLVDPRSGAVWIEYGPAMMWNTRYGMTSRFSFRGPGGMMGGYGPGMMGGGPSAVGGMMGGGTPQVRRSSRTRLSGAQARRLADRWLSTQSPVLRAGAADAFPGYYTHHVLKGSRIAGMLSVNATSGAVWYHWWHGRFVATTG
jgi:hypothetical protein